MMWILLLLVIGLSALFFIVALVVRSTKKLNTAFFQKKWQDITYLASNQVTWVQALIEADKLLDEALKQSHYSGKSTADRMVSANRAFSNADSIWRAHKLRNKVVHEVNFKLQKREFVDAVKGFRRALKDLGAL